ncbi:hypothetical protein FPOAC1_007835 [Fusarium poae]|uniref:hypothetical protein n=1 Tax=Fusarium poae TaxID=36050 RepID=UPI001CEB2298|nr:hypothetical protein FPOAC1_007835 [Fusarium poae]KAG8668456.1 hypothetical protein FPOAC1_007835 [Fusarium poae]
MLPYLPDEILNGIFSHLLTPSQRHYYCRNDRHDDCTQVRLVCRRWNAIATKGLLGTLVLRHSVATINDNFGSWNRLLDSLSFRSDVQRVAIETAPLVKDPFSIYNGLCEAFRWPVSWHNYNAQWPEFESAIDRIRHLPNLDAIELRFTADCLGYRGEMERNWEMAYMGVSLSTTPIEEPIMSREYTLEALKRAMQGRNGNPNLSRVREVVLENLQNRLSEYAILPDVIQDIERLHIKITSEGEGRFARTTEIQRSYRYETRTFPYYLEYRILSFAPNLVELTLAGKNWSGIPGAFRGMDIHFPRLKTLTLGGLDILLERHFDWVLRHKSLTTLRLHQCTIATHCLVQQPEFSFWGVELDGWVRVQDDNHDTEGEHRFHIRHIPRPDHDEPGWYVGPLRWNTLFDSIGEELPLLQDFIFDGEKWETYFRHVEDPYYLLSIDFRYSAFAHCWTHLVLSFGEMPVLQCLDECHYVQAGMPGTPEELVYLTEQADSQALEKLLQTVQTRRRERY